MPATFLAFEFTQGLTVLIAYSAGAPQQQGWWWWWALRSIPGCAVLLVGNLLRHRYWRLSFRRHARLAQQVAHDRARSALGARQAQLRRLLGNEAPLVARERLLETLAKTQRAAGSAERAAPPGAEGAAP